MKLTQKQLGKRLAEIRKAKGFSQEELAQAIQLSRPSLAQIELGNRSIDFLEMRRCAEILGFSLDDFIAEEFSAKDTPVQQDEEMALQHAERISAPKLQLSKFRNVLLYILERCAGKPNVGETVLYKLLYFSDFNYYEIYEEHLTGARYKKLPFGPVPQSFDAVISKMMERGEVQRIKVPYFDKLQTRYIPLKSADLKQLNAAEKDVIDKVIERMSDWNATAISEYSHGDKPCKATENNHYIDYELAFYRRPPYSVRRYEEDGADQF